MQKRANFVLAGASLAVAGWAAEVKSVQSEVVQIPAFVVMDSKAGVFFAHYVPGDIPRWEFLNFESPSHRSAPYRHEKRGDLFLTPLRSFDLRSGDEIVRIAGRAVADMTRAEAFHALLSLAVPQPVTVDVRTLGTKEVRPATFVLQRYVKDGIKVPRSP